MTGRRFTLAVLLATVLVLPVMAQRGYFGSSDDYWNPPYGRPNTTYDGKFTFVRLKYRGYGGMTNEGPGWAHDYPAGETNLDKILSEISVLRPYMDGGNVLALDDPDLFKYPVAYMSEPGYWMPSDAEAAALHAYLLKGGFLIFDDFAGRHWFNLETQMQRVLPQARWVQLDASHPVFDSFFRIVQLPDVSGYRGAPEYWGIFEDNDPAKRLMVVANYNNDIGDYWQWSSQGYFPVELSNEAYKLGVNYIMYGLTH